jgi:hypothetical protein
MLSQIARLPKRSVALRARVVSALLVYRAHMPAQVVRCPERSVALRARLVSALLVHRALMLPQIADVPGLVVALRARVSARLSKLFHHLRGGPLNFDESEWNDYSDDDDHEADKPKMVAYLYPNQVIKINAYNLQRIILACGRGAQHRVCVFKLVRE